METPQTAALKKELNELLVIPKESLMTRSEWGTIRFDGAQQSIESIYEIAGLLSQLPIERLPAGAAQAITASLQAAATWVKRVDAFSIESGANPAAERQEITNNLAVHEAGLYDKAQAWIPFLAYLKGDIPRQLESLQSSVALANKNQADFVDWIDKKKKEQDSILQAMREASADAGVGVFTQDFMDEASARDTESLKWLKRAGAAALATLIFAGSMFFMDPPEGLGPLVQYVSSKLVVLAVLIAVTAWCAGNYRANRHQMTISRHKGHALKTFQAFVQATDNTTVKDAVLLETTRSIFAHSSTGYLREEGASDQSGARVVELVRTGVEGSSTS